MCIMELNEKIPRPDLLLLRCEVDTVNSVVHLVWDRSSRRMRLGSRKPLPYFSSFPLMSIIRFGCHLSVSPSSFFLLSHLCSSVFETVYLVYPSYRRGHRCSCSCRTQLPRASLASSSASASASDHPSDFLPYPFRLPLALDLDLNPDASPIVSLPVIAFLFPSLTHTHTNTNTHH